MGIGHVLDQLAPDERAQHEEGHGHDQDTEGALEGAPVAQAVDPAGEQEHDGAGGHHGQGAQPPAQAGHGEGHPPDDVARCHHPGIG